MTDSKPAITIIIPTLASGQRRETIYRAIASVRGQEGVEVTIMLVVNGNRFDPTLLAELRADPGLKVLYREEGNAPKAVHFGVTQVQTPFFGILDDDDELLPGALKLRVAPLLEDPAIDVVVGNGYREPHTRLNIRHMDYAQREPLLSLFIQNWLGSCAGLYRTSTVTPDFFDHSATYHEWTMLAFQLALKRRIRFLNEPTHQIHDSSSSISKTEAYLLARPQLYRDMLRYDIPADVRRKIREKLATAYHDASDSSLAHGKLGAAWNYHVRSLFLPGGLSFLSYTRKLLPLPGIRKPPPRTASPKS